MRLGEAFTSMIQGFRVSSNIMSNPYISIKAVLVIDDNFLSVNALQTFVKIGIASECRVVAILHRRRKHFSLVPRPKVGSGDETCHAIMVPHYGGLPDHICCHNYI